MLKRNEGDTMTCIAAIVDEQGTVHMGGDSACSNGWSLSILKEPKIFINHGFLIGTSGTARTMQLLRYAFVPPDMPENTSIEAYMSTLFINTMRDVLKDAGAATKKDGKEQQDNFTLVGYQGRLFRIGVDYAVMESQTPYNAIGIGDDIALGVLFAMQPRVPRMVQFPGMSLEQARKAIEEQGKRKEMIFFGNDLPQFSPVDPRMQLQTALEAAEHHYNAIRKPFTFLELPMHKQEALEPA